MSLPARQKARSLGPADGPAAPRALVVLCVGAFMASFDLIVVNVAFRSIGLDFGGSSLSQLSWVLNGYVVVFAALLVPSGRLADRYGRRDAFLLGLTIFTVASVACAASVGVWWLVGFRVVQAIGAAVLTSASLGLVLASSAPEHRARSVEIWTATGAVAAALGPVLGGLLVEVSWRWIFLLNVPVGLLALLATLRWVPDSRDASVTRLPDLLGAALLAAGIGLLSLALVEGPEWGWDAARTDVAWTAAAAGLAGFVVQSRRHASPVVARRLLQVRTFAWSSLTVLVFATPFAASLLAAVLWLQQGWGYSALETGLAITPAPLLVLVFAAVGHRLGDRFPIRLVVSFGCLLCSAGMGLIAASMGAEPAYATEFLPGWVLGGAGVGLSLPALVSVATSDLPEDDAATGSGVVNMNRQIGTALGISLVVAVLGTSTRGSATQAAFQHAWWMIAALAAVTAAFAARMPSRDTRLVGAEAATGELHG